MAHICINRRRRYVTITRRLTYNATDKLRGASYLHTVATYSRYNHLSISVLREQPAKLSPQHDYLITDWKERNTVLSLLPLPVFSLHTHYTIYICPGGWFTVPDFLFQIPQLCRISIIYVMGFEKLFAVAAPKKGSSKSSSKELSVVPLQLEQIFRFPGVLTEVSGVVKNLSEGYTTYKNGVAIRNQLESVVPEVQTFASGMNRYLKNKNWLDLFQTFLVGANVVAAFMEVLQGSSSLEEIGLKIYGELEAQTGLAAPDKFAKHVDKYIRKEASSVYGGDAEHLYFLYHPDTDWHGEFHDIVQKQTGAEQFSRNVREPPRLVINAHFHLLIPAYRPMVVRTAFVFPEELYPLTVRGHIHNSKEYVWLNLPTMKDVPSDLFEMSNVGNIATLPPPPRLWQHALTWVGNIVMPKKEPPPIILGRGQISPNAPIEMEDNEDENEKLKPPEDITIQPGTRQVFVFEFTFEIKLTASWGKVGHLKRGRWDWKGGYLRSVICGLDSCMVILALTSRWNVKWVQ
ncbi:hypothetical protein EYC84_001203 [Monilinia fructicola]|uniref:Uncharacterized protein n=1 Tax=Monilinia fructicola TaxID=38448 RepID=A0A5M9JLQ0_MONFR|nr:hypothetical protein EYC84_001203 [Monilinia fructicola]